MQQSALSGIEMKRGKFELSSFTKRNAYQTYTNLYHSFLIKKYKNRQEHMSSLEALTVQTLQIQYGIRMVYLPIQSPTTKLQQCGIYLLSNSKYWFGIFFILFLTISTYAHTHFLIWLTHISLMLPVESYHILHPTRLHHS